MNESAFPKMAAASGTATASLGVGTGLVAVGGGVVLVSFELGTDVVEVFVVVVATGADKLVPVFDTFGMPWAACCTYNAAAMSLEGVDELEMFLVVSASCVRAVSLGVWSDDFVVAVCVCARNAAMFCLFRW